MLAVTIRAGRGPEQFGLSDVARPAAPGWRDVAAALKAATLNHLDRLAPGGLPGLAVAFPRAAGAASGRRFGRRGLNIAA